MRLKLVKKGGGKSPPWGGFLLGVRFCWGTDFVFYLVSPRKKSTFSAICKIFACGALLNGVLSKFSPETGYKDLFSLHSLTSKVY